ncbi:alanyl-tRNA editing protein [Chloroflexota bacterium]
MTEQVFQTDCYLKEFSATVTQVDVNTRAVQLDKTAFYPGGGGQPCDLGLLTFDDNVYTVNKVKKQGEYIDHYLDGSETLPDMGSKVSGCIDWDRRYKLMRTHTGMHILCGVIFRDYGASVTGGNMDLLKGRMDFEFETLKAEFVHKIENEINEEVKKGLNVRIAIIPRDKAFKIPDLIRTRINLLPPGIKFVRTVEIEGLDLQADGGTHVKNTIEVGRIKIVDYKSKGAINKRIYIELD